MKPATVSKFMTRDVFTLPPDATVREAESALGERGIGGAPVVDAEKRVVGVISQRDLMRVEAERTTAGQVGEFYTDMEEFRDLAEVPVERHSTPIDKLMSRHVLSIGPDASVAEAARLMRKRRVHRLLVTKGDVLVGVLSSLDLLRALAAASERSRSG